MSHIILLIVTLFYVDPKQAPDVKTFEFPDAQSCLAAREISRSKEGQDGVADVEAGCFEVDNKSVPAS
jgi:hypothetical protein